MAQTEASTPTIGAFLAVKPKTAVIKKTAKSFKVEVLCKAIKFAVPQKLAEKLGIKESEAVVC